MPATLHTDLRQRTPFGSLAQEAHLNVLRTATVLQSAFEQMLKPYGLTGAQFNVLRILRGAEPDGLCRNELGERLVTRMPDVTRLLDRMEDLALVTRVRGTRDRRQVTTRLTKQGRRLVDDLDEAVMFEHQRCLGHLTRTQLTSLCHLLTMAREQAARDPLQKNQDA